MASSATYNQVRDSILHKQYAPVYLLTGEESFYIDKLTQCFEENIDESIKDFNCDVLYGKDTNAEAIVSICRQYPFMTDKRFVILKEAQLLDKREWGNKDAETKGGKKLQKLLGYFANPSQQTVLIICNKAKTFDIACKNQIVKNGGMFYESKPISDYKLVDWIVSYLKENKYTFEPQVPTILAEYLGNDLQKIANEVGKMMINLKGVEHITEDAVTKFIGISKQYNVFELENALVRRNVSKANTIVANMIKNPKDNPLQMLLPILFGYFSKILIASQSPDKTSAGIAKALGTTEYIARSYMPGIQNYSMPQLFTILSFFEEYDLKSKGVDVSPNYTSGDLLQELVYKILYV
ncbi:MAG: DNA polymerase III subunit delta [Bacteroidales bacterium]|nr:DNA polymerase III subunit delta [Bacteroidales bacterium]